MYVLPDFSVSSSSIGGGALIRWLSNLTWTPESISEWQEFYNNASRLLYIGRSANLMIEYLPKLPEYKDLKPVECKRAIQNTTLQPVIQNTTLEQEIQNAALQQKSFVLFIFITFVITNVFF